jgi:bifunctional isochorismate lyase / aryl carrier protein
VAVGIPVITGYAMPDESELPVPVVGWQPDRHRAVLLVHDMQNYFLDRFPAGTAPLTDLVANAVRLRTYAAVAGIPVLYTAQSGGMSRAERGLLHDFWGAGMGTDPGSRAIVTPLAPGPDDVVLTKRRYSAFHASPLAELLAQWGRDQLVLCGVFAHIGCLVTACDALAQDIQTFFVADAVADFSLPEHRMALEYAAGRCASVLSTRQVLARMDGAGPTPESPGPAHLDQSRVELQPT